MAKHNYWPMIGDEQRWMALSTGQRLREMHEHGQLESAHVSQLIDMGEDEAALTVADLLGFKAIYTKRARYNRRETA